MIKDLFWLIIAVIIAAIAIFGIVLKIACWILAIIFWLL
jgi:hypothetical protein